MSSFLRTISKNILKRQGIVRQEIDGVLKPYPRAVLNTKTLDRHIL